MRLTNVVLPTALLLSIVAGPLALPGCGSKGAASGDVLATKVNRRYGLTLRLHGERLSLDGGRSTVVKYVTIRAEQNGRDVRFVPLDSASLESSEGFFLDVWSPDEQLLVLPLGRFEGFCVIRANQAVDLVANQKCGDFVRVELDTGAQLWHEFERWDGPSTFTFRAGLSGDRTRFAYDVRQHHARAESPVSESFRLVTSQGAVRIASTPPQ
jgi:hypothetical protein